MKQLKNITIGEFVETCNKNYGCHTCPFEKICVTLREIKCPADIGRGDLEKEVQIEAQEEQEVNTD